jgi:tryptophanyl-tRNA synthetase
MNCAGKISDFFGPLRTKRQYYENHLSEVKDILYDGEIKARLAAGKTMKQVREKMKMG